MTPDTLKVDPNTPEGLETWIAALESGDYPKGKYKLRSKGCFCCLGVLADLNGLLAPAGTDPSKEHPIPGGEGKIVINSVPVILDRHTQHIIAMLNDKSDTFEPVVEMIRELFVEEEDADD